MSLFAYLYDGLLSPSWVPPPPQQLADLVTIQFNCSDYDVFLSPLSDFKRAMEEAGLGDKVVYLDRKDAYRFRVGG